jgi:EAL domain-containing protein (putative c-di-GMP-specific phosphodiesterase class I)
LPASSWPRSRRRSRSARTAYRSRRASGWQSSDDAVDADGLQALAEAAARQAKAQGGNCCRLHDERLDGAVRGEAADADRLRRAIENGALIVHFQPQVTLCSAELGLASLVRWRHDSLGVVAGDAIRSLAETTALTEPLTDWLIGAACRQAARWRAAGLPRLHVAVPLLSRRQLAWSGLAARVEAHLAAAGIPPDWLELELDERLLLHELQGDGRALGAVRELGVRLAVDGFGDGGTSLSVLRDTPLTTVKLARAMLHGIPEDRHRTLFAGTVIELARQLRLRLVAEGIESQAQLQLLKAQGCDAVQSFISCPPLPADACTDWLRQAAHRA